MKAGIRALKKRPELLLPLHDDLGQLSPSVYYQLRLRILGSIFPSGTCGHLDRAVLHRVPMPLSLLFGLLRIPLDLLVFPTLPSIRITF